MRRKLLSHLAETHGPLFKGPKKPRGEVIIPVRAALYIFYKVADGAPGYRQGFSSQEIDECFVRAARENACSIVWQRFFIADGRAGFERLHTANLSEREWSNGCFYQIRDRKSLCALLKKYPEALLRFDNLCSPF